jgi:hypothetical protein
VYTPFSLHRGLEGVDQDIAAHPTLKEATLGFYAGVDYQLLLSCRARLRLRAGGVSCDRQSLVAMFVDVATPGQTLLLRECETLELACTKHALHITRAHCFGRVSLEALASEQDLSAVSFESIARKDLETALQIPCKTLRLRGDYLVSLKKVCALLQSTVEVLILNDFGCTRGRARAPQLPHAKLELRSCELDDSFTDSAWMQACWQEIRLVDCVQPGGRTINGII